MMSILKYNTNKILSYLLLSYEHIKIQLLNPFRQNHSQIKDQSLIILIIITVA
jgi:hypothetical protein